MAGPSKPSSKDYTAVPTEERIDDGVEEPQRVSEDNDDEGLYTSSAPLLSGRTRGNEPPSERHVCWYHKMASWRPFKRNPYSSWEPPKKRNWRKIIFGSFIGLLVAAVVALSISTGVLAGQLDHTKSSCRNNRSPSWRRYSRLPFSKSWMSSNHNLNFGSIYPPLEEKPWWKTQCQAAWNRLTYIPCHEKILNRAWDDGKMNSLFDPDISLYAQPMCSPSCTAAVNNAFAVLSAECTEDDKFNMTGYRGPFVADAGLEDGPLGVITTIQQRLSHTCRQAPSTPGGFYYNTDFCAANMFTDWAIVDGKNAGNLEGLEQFEARTEVHRFEFSHYEYAENGKDPCDNLPSYYAGRRLPERRFGPTVNSTTCDYCTMNWFERKLMAWEKDAVRDPKTGNTVSLEKYLLRIKNAGQRCDADAWDRTWQRALRKYKQTGQLDEDWDGEEDTPKPKPGKGKKPGKETPGKGKSPGKGKKPCKDGENAEEVFNILPVITIEAEDADK